MATFLDFGFLGNFSPIFTLILMFAIMYGILHFTKFLGDKNGLQALIAMVIAILASINGTVVAVISSMTPWFVLLFVFILFMILGFKVMGASDSDILGVIKGARYGTTIGWWMVILSIIILVIGISGATGQQTLKYSPENDTLDVNVMPPSEGPAPGEPGSTATGNFETNLKNTLFHPKILGMVVIILIAAIAVTMLSKTMPK